MPLKLFTNRYCQQCRAVEIFLLVNEIPYEKVLMEDPIDYCGQVFDSHITPTTLRDIPVLRDEGFVAKGSSAILKYLCKSKNLSDNWYPKDLKKRARIDESLAWHFSETAFKANAFMRFMMVDPVGVILKVKERKNYEKILHECLHCLEEVWLGERQFLCGDEITICDLVAATEIEQLILVDFDLKKTHTRLNDWIGRVREATKPHYEDVHKELYLVSEKLGKVLGKVKDILSKL